MCTCVRARSARFSIRLRVVTSRERDSKLQEIEYVLVEVLMTTKYGEK